MTGCKLGREHCGKLDCAWGCAAQDGPPPVPTAMVPRASGYLKEVGPRKPTSPGGFVPSLPAGDWMFSVTEDNALIARSPGRPVIHLDEITMTWKELTT